MRVLHVYSGNLYGGIETMLVTLARYRELCPEMTPHFALCFEGRLSEELTATGASVYQLGNVRVSRPSSVRRARRTLGQLLKTTGFDVVVCHAPWVQAIFGSVVRDAGLPLIFWLHNTADGRHWTERWARRTPPDMAICNSQFTASTLSNLYREVRAEVLYYPIGFPKLQPSNEECLAVRNELDTPKDSTVIIQVSRMERWKGHALHLEALGRLRELKGWVCWFVGGAQRPHEIAYEKELREIATRLGIADRIRFAGQRSDVLKLLCASDIHCQPNLEAEPFGITFIEALYTGLPVVTFAMGGATEIVNDSCGVLVPPGDTDALAEVLRRLINDRALRTALGEAGPARARELCDPAAQMVRMYGLTECAL